MGEAATNRMDGSGGPSKSKLISSDSPTQAQTEAKAEEPQYVVDGKPVSREAYMTALPQAGYVPERMPANFFPAISTK